MANAGDVSRHGMWSSRWMFILAAAGSAVGLGNIWRFPYMAGETGGGAFVLVYLLCVALVGIPIMMSEVLCGRSTRMSPINTMRTLTARANAHPAWVLVGWMGALSGFFILSFYGVIAGWALHYVVQLGSGAMEGVTAEVSAAAFADFQARPGQMILWQTLFMALTVWIVARGVSGGLELAIRLLMPLLFVILGVLVVYAANSGGFAEGLRFLFRFEWGELGVGGVLAAMGQAFFTLSLGMGAIMAYGAYVPAQASLTSTVATIAVLDTLVAVVAGLAIFPLVFANGLEPGAGPGLLFETLPIAFGQMPMGTVFGAVFFLLVSFAAITSAISLVEPALAWMVEEFNAQRHRAAITIGFFTWLLGLGSVFSFNWWAEFHLVGQLTIFDFLDFITANIMLPLGGLFTVLFVGWVLPRTGVAREQLRFAGLAEGVWQVLVRGVAPAGVLIVFVVTLRKAVGG